MARIRYLKPDFFLDDSLAELSFPARITFSGLWCYADREGRLEDTPKKLKVEIMPYDNVDMESILTELHPRFIFRYEVKGKKYIEINNFSKHQRPHPNESKSLIPPSNRENKLQEIILHEDSGIKGMGMGIGTVTDTTNGNGKVNENRNRLEKPYFPIFCTYKDRGQGDCELKCVPRSKYCEHHKLKVRDKALSKQDRRISDPQKVGEIINKYLGISG